MQYTQPDAVGTYNIITGRTQPDAVGTYNIITCSTQTDALGWLWFNVTFNNISVISWKSVLLIEATRVPGENHRPVASH